MDIEDMVRVSLFANILQDLFLGLERQLGVVYVDREWIEDIYSQFAGNSCYVSPYAATSYNAMQFRMPHADYDIQLNPILINCATA